MNVISSVFTRTVAAGSPRHVALLWRALLCAATVALPATLTSQAPGETQAAVSGNDLPVRSVMLFSSGVAFFDHRGMVRDSGFAELRFRTAELNDVLKSLTLRDAGTGSFTAVTLPSHDPLEKQLGSYRVNLSANPSLSELLNQLRGANVTIRSSEGQLRGSVIGVHRRSGADTAAAAATGESDDVINIFTGAAIQSVRVSKIESFTLDDPALREELHLALGAISRARDNEHAPVRIHFRGSGHREVGVGYLTASPVWKTSYRLVLGDTTALIHGWAIVENQTGTDWKDIALSLVSGQPVSFAMDLHTPQYQARPVVQGFRQVAVSPVLYGAGVAADRPSEALRMERSAAGGSAALLSGVVTTGTTDPATGSRAPFSISAATPSDAIIQMRNPLATQAVNVGTLGDLFEYRIASVSVPRQQSAMIPIVNDSIPVERVSIFSSGLAPGLLHPLNGVILRNTTGSNLLHGPVTVLDGDAYAGDSRIGNIADTTQRLISYGVDLEMTVDTESSSELPVLHRIWVTNGVVRMERRGGVRTTYRINSRRDASRAVVIEHVRRPNATLGDSAGFFESTPAVHRFRGVAGPHRISTLNVTENMLYTSNVPLASMAVKTIQDQILIPGIPDQVRVGVEYVVEVRNQITRLEGGIAERDRMIAEIAKEQERIRENMKTVGGATEYYDRLLAKLNSQETDLERLGTVRREMAAELAVVQAQLAEFIAKFNVTRVDG